jgi:hypothetical protein
MADDGYQSDDDVHDQLRDALYGLLIDKIRRDRYPSVTMMNRVEEGMDRRQLRRYAQVLLEKVEDDRYPSLDMMQRLARLA